LRAELEPLRRGRSLDLLDAEQQMAYARMTDRATVIMVFNNDTKPATVEFDVTEARLANGARMLDRLGASQEVRVEGGRMRVSLPARRAAILTVR
jgi:hypothetical protein